MEKVVVSECEIGYKERHSEGCYAYPVGIYLVY